MRGRKIFLGLGLAAVVLGTTAAISLSCGSNATSGASCGGATAAVMTPMQASFAVDKVTCNGCVKKINKAIKTIDGVQKYTVDRTNAAVYVAYVPAKTTPEAICAAITTAGYPARLIAINEYAGGKLCPPGCAVNQGSCTGKAGAGMCPYGGKAKATHTSTKSSTM
jgi:copper chaperone CopZ